MSARIPRKGVIGASAAMVLFAALLVPPAAAQAGLEKPELKVASASGKNSLEFHLTAQFRWEYKFIDKGSGGERDTDHKLIFRRLRPVIKGSLLTKDFTYLLHLNLVPGYLELMDLWVEYAFHPLARVRLGQFKIPFTRYRLNSFQDLPVVEWSNPTRWIGAERQLGIMLHNGLAKPPALEYQLAIFTGQNARASNAKGIPVLYGEPITSPSSLTDPAGWKRPHGEFAAHIAYNYGGISVKKPSDLEGGKRGFSVGMSAAWDFQPVVLEDMRLRLAPEIMVKARGFAISSVFYIVFWDKAAGPGMSDLGMVGVVLQMSYVFLRKYEVALRYTDIYVYDELREDARRYADSRIAAAETAAEADALAEQFADNGQIHSEREVNLGFNVYLMGTTLKWQTDVGLMIHGREDGNRYDVQLRSQLQLAF